MTQTLAIFYEAYRSLNAKKMFWIVLWLSALVAGAFACVGINEDGLKLLVWQFHTDPLTSDLVEPPVFYKLLFANLGIGVWLTWLAAILALVSTAGIFPDLINSGSIHLLVSKPIGRLRLFVTQYAAGLLFVSLQVALFTAACFLVIGLRGGAWEPGLFVAVPVVVCFFSYLFSVCVLLGLVTRSTLAALLLTLLFWFFVYFLGAAENFLLLARKQKEHGSFGPAAARMHTPDNRPPAISPVPAADAPADDDPSAQKRSRRIPRAVATALLKAVAKPSAADENKRPKERKRTVLGASTSDPADGWADADDDGKETSEKLKMAHDVVYYVKTFLPKTTETIGLLERSLYSAAELPSGVLGQPYEHQKAEREFVEAIRGRSVWWIVGTSLGFEAFVLCLAAWIFCRRDY